MASLFSALDIATPPFRHRSSRIRSHSEAALYQRYPALALAARHLTPYSLQPQATAPTSTPTMSYTVLDKKRFRIAQSAPWYLASEAQKLNNILLSTDYSVVDSRRQTHAALDTFQADAEPGSTLFGTSRRFPDGDNDLYLTRLHSDTRSILAKLAAVLSWRATTVAKDVRAGQPNERNGGTGREPQTEAANQSAAMQETQDNTKRFEALTLQFQNLIVSPDALYDRDSFEKMYSLTWTAAAPPS